MEFLGGNDDNISGVISSRVFTVAGKLSLRMVAVRYLHNGTLLKTIGSPQMIPQSRLFNFSDTVSYTESLFINPI